MKDSTFEELFREAEKSLTYWVEGAILDFTEELCREMESQGVSRAELARRIGSSPAYVTKILRGNSNFTLSSMVRISRALDREVRIHLAPKGAMTRWIDELPPVTVSTASAVTAPLTGDESPTITLIEAA